MQLKPDWEMTGTAEDIERELQGFIFKGPGSYITKTDIIIIFALDDETTKITQDNIWHQKWSKETRFSVNVYNCSPEHLVIFALHYGTMPNRYHFED